MWVCVCIFVCIFCSPFSSKIPQTCHTIISICTHSSGLHVCYVCKRSVKAQPHMRMHPRYLRWYALFRAWALILTTKSRAPKGNGWPSSWDWVRLRIRWYSVKYSGTCHTRRFATVNMAVMILSRSPFCSYFEELSIHSYSSLSSLLMTVARLIYEAIVLCFQNSTRDN